MTIHPMRTSLALAVLVGCGGHADSPDATPPDAPDAAVTLDCATYCARIEVSCTGEHAQYPDQAHCMAACASFTAAASTVTDMAGNTLGCRIYHAGAPSRTMPSTHCAHAGPGGDRIAANPPAACSGGDVCASFCALQIKACGSVEEPLPGNPKDANGNPFFQFQNMTNCMANCAKFDKTHEYSTTAAGDSLACRMLHVTSAAIDLANAKTECAYTGDFPTGPCEGPPMP